MDSSRTWLALAGAGAVVLGSWALYDRLSAPGGWLAGESAADRRKRVAELAVQLCDAARDGTRVTNHRDGV